MSRYLNTQERLPALLATGVLVQASTEPHGKLTVIDSVEFTRLRFRGLDAVDVRTGKVVFYNLRIDGFEFVAKLKQQAQGPESSTIERADQPDHWASLKERMAACRGDRLPLLIEWARLKYGKQKLPPRQQMLKDFRKFFGALLGVNEKTMRDVRRHLVTEQDRRGGAPTHRRHLPQ